VLARPANAHILNTVIVRLKFEKLTAGACFIAYNYSHKPAFFSLVLSMCPHLPALSGTTEMADEQQRTEVMDEILTYNEEDLQATWAVLQWLKSRAS